ncbi:MAG: hypothetical protein AUI11_02705 [Acidobacteria bacterium 13_2_20CM_2_66_4]|nr:MAG: hypothetical protein AUI11_02705 [Acidobacteria bacterium 13_2_20CM_2_66_4]
MLVVVWLLFAAAVAAGEAQPPRSGQTVIGVAVDGTGAVLPGAQVDLMSGPAIVQTTSTDPTGTFRFVGVPPGRYEVRVRYEGFQPTAIKVTVGGRTPSPLRIALPLANVTQEITVSNQAPEIGTGAASNSDAVAVDQEMLAALPMFDQDYIATLSRFLDSGSIGTAGPTLVVNGMEVSALRVSASAVQQIKINQDPYSAEYARPGRGRIEILTRPGSQDYHGEANIIFRDAALNARNAFAPTRPPERRRIVEGMLGGPFGGAGRTSFLLSGHDEMEDQQAVVFAIGPSGEVHDVAPQPNRQSLLAFSITRQRSERITFSIRPNLEYESDRNRGVGGTTLASAGTNFEHNEQQITYTQQTIVRPTLLHQVQLLVGHEREPYASASPARGLVVSGAFTGGGGQVDLLRTELHMQLTTSLAWTRNRHLIQTGFQLPDWSRRGFYDRSNFGGTFYFASLDAYSAGTPYSFVQQRGDGDLAFHGKTNVIRAGAGVFNDRSGPVAIADLLHYRAGGLVRYVISDPAYPDPFQSPGASAPPPSIVQLAPDVRIPQTLQYSVGIDHQLRKTTTLSVTYTSSRGYDMFRSRDVNAPPPPSFLARPDPSLGVVRQIEANGRQQSDSLQATLRGKVTRWFNGQMQYTFSRARNDTNGIGSYPANDYDLSGEWARADFDRPHRFLLLGRLTPWKVADVGLGLTMTSAGPYTELLGGDVYNNGRGRARPKGVARNTLEGAGFASVDLRVSRELKIGRVGGSDGRAMTLGFDAFNLLNRVNYGAYVGTLESPLFRQPVTARSARQLQLSARVKF